MFNKDKTNEIPIVQSLVSNLPFKGVTYGMDAMHCQKKTLEAIVQSGNQALIQVKENQPMLLMAMHRASNMTKKVQDSASSHELNRERIEDRECFVYDHFLPFDDRRVTGWKAISSFVKMKRSTLRKDYSSKNTYTCNDWSFYLSTASHNGKWFLDHIRSHWGIENTNHHIRDVSFAEDTSKVKVCPEVMTILRSFAFNIVKHTPSTEKSVAQALFANALSQDSLLEYINS